MPIFEYECQDCGVIFENIEVWSNHKATKCKECGSPNIKKVLTSFQYRSDPDTVKHNMPDPSPPLEELRGKGSDGYQDKPYASSNLGEYTRTHDKQGNTIWLPKKRIYSIGKGK